MHGHIFTRVKGTRPEAVAPGYNREIRKDSLGSEIKFYTTHVTLQNMARNYLSLGKGKGIKYQMMSQT